MVSSDPELRKRYRADKFCSFTFTCKVTNSFFKAAYRHFLSEWTEKIPLSLR